MTRTRGIRVWLWIFSLLISLPVSAKTPSQNAKILDLKPTVLLISLDGFRADYLDRYRPTQLLALGAGGVRAASLKPTFPTLTFPNHYTLVTGLRPERHGIIGNVMRDPTLPGLLFTLSDQPVVKDPRWWEGEPIWNTAVRNGQKSAIMFWPGSDVLIHGQRPTYWHSYDEVFPYPKRVAEILRWLDLPVAERPTLLGLYFESPDSEAHEHGPESAETKKAVAQVDAQLATLFAGLRQRGIFDKVNIIVVSDHGMQSVDPQKTIVLSKYFDVAKAEILGGGALATIWPKGLSEEDIYRKLVGAHPQLKVWKKNEIPESWGYRNHRRVAPLLVQAKDGYYIQTIARPVAARGAHGYDPETLEMHGIFLAHGPAFRRGYRRTSVDNIHLYALMSHLLSLSPAPHQGSLDAVKDVLHTP